MNGYVKYRDSWLARNSEAYEMYMDKDFNKLDKHLKQLAQNEIELIKRYDKKD